MWIEGPAFFFAFRFFVLIPQSEFYDPQC